MHNKLVLYFNTIRHLKLSQILYRLTNQMKQELYKKNIIKISVPRDLEIATNMNYIIPELDFNNEYLDRFNIEEILNNKFEFINIKKKVELSNAWHNNKLQQLWRYNLHYFEYLYRLAFEYSSGDKSEKYYEKFKYLIENWIENNPFPYGDGWHPYTISLRLTNWIATYQIFKNRINLDNDFNNIFKKSMYLQYKYLQSNVEKDVLGNHYFENIKALIIASNFFEETKIQNKFRKELLRQLDEQILKDGMHFELSPMYHQIILEDLIKITYWLKEEPIYNQLIVFVQKMIDTAFSFEAGFGKTPAFNDSANGISKDFKCLLQVCEKYFGLTPKFKDSFEHSGFYIVKNKMFKLIFDNGDICPSYLPAHGHCDALSFELSINNTPLIVNSGTYRYESGKWRNYFRSTKSHNTVMVSNQEQSQYWSSFRVAKRITKVKRNQFIHNNVKFFSGAYMSYHGVDHKRYIGIIDDDKILVLDKIKPELNDSINSYVHFVPGVKIDIKKNTVQVLTSNETIQIIAIGTENIDIEKGWYSKQFNVKEENSYVIFKKKNESTFFGYLIDLNSNNIKITESEYQLNIIGNQEIIINVDELGDLL